MSRRNEPGDDESGFQTALIELLARGALHTLRHGTFEELHRWLLERAERDFATAFKGFDPLRRRAAVTQLARGLWSSVPLRSDGWRRPTMPPPERNAPCICGSGQKYKRCCADAPSPMPIPEDVLVYGAWATAPREEIRSLAGEGLLPPEWLEMFADHAADQDGPEAVVELLEPLLADRRSLGREHVEVLDRLLGAYTDCQLFVEREEVLAALEAEGSAPVQAVARRRLAMVTHDRGEREEAWRWLRAAADADPTHYDLFVLELTMLLAERRVTEARERSRLWIRRLERDRTVPPPIVELCRTATRDPDFALATVGINARTELTTVLARVATRPIASYEVTAVVDRAGLGETTLKLVTPASLRRAEEDWQEVRPVEDENEHDGSPYDDDEDDDDDLDDGVDEDDDDLDDDAADEGGDDEDDLDDAPEEWILLLARKPVLLDSLKVLDDLTEFFIDEGTGPSLDAAILLPLAQRAARIVEATLPASSGPLAPWTDSSSAALRLLGLLAELDAQAGRLAEAAARYDWLLELAPYDGLTLTLASHVHARLGNDARVVELVGSADWTAAAALLDAALAALRLGQGVDASTFARRSIERSRATVERLIEDPTPRTVGTEEEWEEKFDAAYRDAMGEVWDSTPGAIDWLRGELAKVPLDPGEDQPTEGTE